MPEGNKSNPYERAAFAKQEANEELENVTGVDEILKTWGISLPESIEPETSADTKDESYYDLKGGELADKLKYEAQETIRRAKIAESLLRSLREVEGYEELKITPQTTVEELTSCIARLLKNSIELKDPGSIESQSPDETEEKGQKNPPSEPDQSV